MDQREPNKVVQFYHGLPHVNISFTNVGNTFDPDSSQYSEALGILATVPVAWLLLTLLTLLTYFLTRCCDKQLKVPRALEPHRWVLGFTAVLCCGATAVGLYGNDDFHSGAIGFATALQMIQDNVEEAQTGANSIDRAIQVQIEPQTQTLTKLLEKTLPNQNSSSHSAMVQQMRIVVDSVINVSDNLKLTEHTMRGINLQSFASGTKAVEMVRWPLTIGLLSFFIFLCLILVYGIVKGSRCTILLFTVFGLVSVVLNWLLASVYLTFAVAGGDLCINPGAFAVNLSRDASTKDLVSYYVYCDGLNSHGPIGGPIRDARIAIEAADSGMKRFVEYSKNYYSHRDVHPAADRLQRHLGTTAHNLSTLAGLLDCRPTHQQYRRAVLNICELGVFGLTFMLLSSIGTGLLLTILVWVGSHVWIYLKTRKGYLQVADQEPFLPLSASSASRSSGSGRSPYAPNAPPPGSNTNSLRYHTRHSHTPPQTPPFPGTLNGKGTLEDRDRTLTLRKTHETSLTTGTTGRRSPPAVLGPNNGQYATLSKSCKTLESSDFY